MEKDLGIVILEAIKKKNSPLGATFLSQELNIPQASIGRELLRCEEKGWLKKVSNKGRQLTKAGLDYIEKAAIRHSKLETADQLVNISKNASKKKLIEVLEVRKLLETKTAELACCNATDNELIELDRIMAEYCSVVKNGHLGDKQDLKLHLYIAKMARDTTLYNIINLIMVEGEAYSEFSMAAKHSLNTQLEMHDQIVKAIINRDAHLAIKLTTENLDRIITALKKEKPINALILRDIYERGNINSWVVLV